MIIPSTSNRFWDCEPWKGKHEVIFCKGKPVAPKMPVTIGLFFFLSLPSSHPNCAPSCTWGLLTCVAWNHMPRTHPVPTPSHPTMEQQLDPVPERVEGGWAKMKSNWEALGSVDAAGAEPRQLPAQPSQQQNLEARRGSILLLTAHLGWEVLCGDTVLGKSAVRFAEGESGGEVNGIWGFKPLNQTTVKSRICKPGSKEQSFSIEYWACKPNQLKLPLVNEDVEAK